MKESIKSKPGLIQHKVRAELKRWIEDQAKAQERSQGWIANKMLEESFARAQEQGRAVQP